ncbi:phage integrase N-terminal domain-containing protein [Marinomonas gallaica]|uniref:phage integrase N-terminal domain-containing protein n=1 Tax=Marinomonas gallaica TaxID=1806667 RepID=UPI00083134E9|nr:phage integrase N-terminal domain-containing protein [Marinomonas gallaica]
MSQLGFRLNEMIYKTHREGSHSTRASRKRLLNQMAESLIEAGYKVKDPSGLKGKHVEHLINAWKAQGLAEKTIKNRLSALRWWSTKINKQNIVATTNDAYGIARVQSSPLGKSRELDLNKLNQVTCPLLRFSLRLQSEFGLRREEAIKFALSYADQEDRIRIKGSWAKGGKPREILITKVSQRALLNEIRVVTTNSLIKPTERYVDQLKRYERQTAKVGLSKNHGLRHHYARERYLEMTGWKCPADGGPSRKSLSAEQRSVDENVRMIVSKELGHERLQITYTYLGS